jgi:hypothetical protein
MLDTAGLSKEWWGEAILTASHVLNRVPTKSKEKTPFEEWKKKRLTLSYLRTWGCLAKVNVPFNKKRKLGPKTVDCVFLGYAINSVGYRFLVVKSRVPDMRVGGIFESRDATFFENEFPMRGNVPSTSSEGAPDAPDTFVPVEYTEQPTTESLEEEIDGVARKSKRPRITKSFANDFAIYLVDDTRTTIKEAFSSPTLTIGRKRYRVRWIRLCPMVLEKRLIVRMVANL